MLYRLSPMLKMPMTYKIYFFPAADSTSSDVHSVVCIFDRRSCGLSVPVALRLRTELVHPAQENGKLNCISNIQLGMERAGFEIHDEEGWRPHYALTLHHGFSGSKKIGRCRCGRWTKPPFGCDGCTWLPAHESSSLAEPVCIRFWRHAAIRAGGPCPWGAMTFTRYPAP